MHAVAFTLIPVAAVLIGSLFALSHRPSDALASAMQHLAAVVVFAAAAAEILPKVLHEGSPIATLTGGSFGIIVMLSLTRWQAQPGGLTPIEKLVCRTAWDMRPRDSMHICSSVRAMGSAPTFIGRSPRLTTNAETRAFACASSPARNTSSGWPSTDRKPICARTGC